MLVEGRILIFYRADADAGVIEIKRFWDGARYAGDVISQTHFKKQN